MQTEVSSITADSLRNLLERGAPVSILDIRPVSERAEWSIPTSIHIDAFEQLKSGDASALSGLHLDPSIPVVTVCAAGRTAAKAAELLQHQGYQASVLQNGMKGWSLAWNTATLAGNGYEVVQVRRTGKGCLSYIISADGAALVLDASLPVDVYTELIRAKGWTLVAVAETHLHADHLSRSKALADTCAVPLYLPAQTRAQFPFRPVHAGDRLQVGGVSLRAISTPGHTLDSTSYLLQEEVLFSGDTLFTNSIGRPDLKASEAEARQRTAMLYSSLQALQQLPAEVVVLPAHTSRPVPFDQAPIRATIGELREGLPLLQLSPEEFTRTILERIPPTPPNYLAISEKNTRGELSETESANLEAGANRCAV